MYRWVEAIEEIIIQCRPRRRRHKRRRTTHKSPTAPLMGAHFFFRYWLFSCCVFESLYVVRFFFLCFVLFSWSTFSFSPFRCTVCKFLWLFRQRRGERDETGARWGLTRSIFLLSFFSCWNVSMFSHTRTREIRRRTSSWRPPSAAQRQGVFFSDS